jgi:parallel beta-helix repeat protein
MDRFLGGKQMQKRCRNLWIRQPFILALTGALSFGAHSARAAQVNCGDVLTEDIVLENDLSGCAGDTLIVGADQITIDLNGHTLAGGGCVSGSEEGTVGIRIDGHHHVVIRNGKISGFGTGIVLSDAHHNLIEDCEISSSFQGIVLSASHHNGMDGLNLEKNCVNAITLIGSKDNRIEGSEVTINGFELSKPGIVLSDSQGNLIQGNTVNGNAEDGIELRNSRNNRIAGNVLHGNGGHGLELIGSDHNTIEENDTLENTMGIALFSSGHNRVQGNRSAAIGSEGNHSHGIALMNGSGKNDVRYNAGTNDGDGIHVELGSTGNHLMRNTESGNVGFDLRDDNPGCDDNRWKHNSFSTSSSDSGCIE